MATTKMKTPLTMSGREFYEWMLLQISDLTKQLDAALDRMERLLGPPPRPDLSLVPPEEKSNA
jgi:hypothetical protein